MLQTEAHSTQQPSMLSRLWQKAYVKRSALPLPVLIAQPLPSSSTLHCKSQWREAASQQMTSFHVFIILPALLHFHSDLLSIALYRLSLQQCCLLPLHESAICRSTFWMWADRILHHLCSSTLMWQWKGQIFATVSMKNIQKHQARGILIIHMHAIVVMLFTMHLEAGTFYAQSDEAGIKIYLPRAV